MDWISIRRARSSCRYTPTTQRYAHPAYRRILTEEKIYSQPFFEGGAAAAGFKDFGTTWQGQLARYKHPEKVVFVDALPRNAMGKVAAANVKKMIDDS